MRAPGAKIVLLASLVGICDEPLGCVTDTVPLQALLAGDAAELSPMGRGPSNSWGGVST